MFYLKEFLYNFCHICFGKEFIPNYDKNIKYKSILNNSLYIYKLLLNDPEFNDEVFIYLDPIGMYNNNLQADMYYMKYLDVKYFKYELPINKFKKDILISEEKLKEKNITLENWCKITAVYLYLIQFKKIYKFENIINYIESNKKIKNSIYLTNELNKWIWDDMIQKNILMKLNKPILI